MIVNEKSLKNIKIFTDLLLLNLSFILAGILAQSLELFLTKSFLFILLFILNLIWIFVANSLNFYNDHLKLFAFQLTSLLKLIVFQAITSILFIFIVKEGFFTRNFILLYSFFLLILLSLRHIFFKKVMTILRKKGKSIKKVLIIGGGKVGREMGNLISANPDFGYIVLGYLDNYSSDPDVLGTLDQINEFIPSVNEVFISNSDAPTESIDTIVKTCNKNAVGVHIIPDYFRFVSKKFQISTLGNIPVISVRSIPLEEFQWRFVKRTFDVITSILATVLILSWLIPVVALIIKLNSKGPICFKQKRIGRHNRTFICYKFRTMFIAPDSDKFIPVSENDSRITSVGKFLRKFNLDELPQFINVLKGDMSVVGPRPHAVLYNEQYKEFIEEIRLRNLVKPGISGWAQIHGLRGDDPNPVKNEQLIIKRIEFDIWYIENWSFTLDLQIIFLTIWRAIKGDATGK
ncbi:MAG: undecaprenyl-phosphate glucose phosphotransferase [Ignavibacteriales bacterium]|nr:undecaprenyl-phosphate glucose phosphotransferase [Ignavibacteriales bacterium]